MAHIRAPIFLAFLVGTCHAGFYNNFTVVYGPQNIHPNDSTDSVEIALTSDGMGATFSTNDTYLFGSFSTQLQLVPKDSAGTASAFFLISNTDNHDEIDFEFLGNSSGEPYLLHSNLFVNGIGGREQDIYLWFDPTTSFHTYQVIWNHKLVLWLVDDIPIRVYENLASTVFNYTFPSVRPMVISSCIFDASTWATQGGAVPINYTDAPFNVNFKNFVFDACLADGNLVGSCTTNYAGNWWEAAAYQTVNSNMANQLAWVRRHYLHYDYCTDSVRYPTPPVECSYNSAISELN